MNFNNFISKYFWKNTKVTILVFIALILTGLYSIFSLQTTGFPSPNLGFVIIRTIYPQATSNEVLDNVTLKIEDSLDSYTTEIESLTSNSSSNVSIITLGLKPNVNVDKLVSEINTELASINFPEGVEKPSIIVPEISSSAYTFSVHNNDLNDNTLGKLSEQLMTEIKSIKGVKSADFYSKLENRIIINLDENKAKLLGVSKEDIIKTINSINESLPITTGLNINGSLSSVIISLDSKDIEDLKNLEIHKTVDSKVLNIKLSDVVSIENKYEWVNAPAIISNIYSSNSTNAVLFDIKNEANVDLNNLTLKIEEKINDFLKLNDKISIHNPSIKFNKDNIDYVLTRHRVTSDQNNKQVSEVISGLLGGPLKIDAPFNNIGYLLGGIQLILLVMIAFVSWRAAIISAISIPLSLIFSTIYLYIIGESLNTMVLFSLVLVVGLVVDPALVLLESIQRKYDSGLTGYDAIKSSIDDVGKGVFLAALTNIIVFAPFGVISGFIGEIFKYIPLTIVPATIGSYFVPIIFLTWLSGKFLKPNKTKVNYIEKVPAPTYNITNDEEYRLLWGIAKKLIKFNYKLINFKTYIKVFIIIILFIIPLAITSIYFSTGMMKSTQFSSTGGTGYIQIKFALINNLAEDKKLEYTKSLITDIAKLKICKDLFPYNLQGSNIFLCNIGEDAKDPKNKVREINNIISKNQNLKYFTDYLVNEVAGAGGGSQDFQINIALTSTNLDTLIEKSPEFAKIVENMCFVDNKYIILEKNTNCNEKVIIKSDDSVTNKNADLYNIVVNRKNLNIPPTNAPFTAAYYGQLKGILDPSESNKKIGNYKKENISLPIFLRSDAKSIKDIDSLKDITIFSTTGPSKLDNIADIELSKTKGSILRVNGSQLNVVSFRVADKYNNPAVISQINNSIINYFNDKPIDANIKVETYSAGGVSSFVKSFSELGIALVIAILLTYLVLVFFFDSFVAPLVILYTIPLSLIGVIPGLAHLATGEFGFLEIIGMIILIGIVENVAIFLIDSARQKVNIGWTLQESIAFASGLRLRPVVLTTICALASLTPLALFSPFYRSIAIVIMFGILSSGIVSLITTPLLYTLFKKK